VREIMIMCPVKKRPIPTGLTTNSVIFESLPDINVPIRCPSCGRQHVWSRGKPGWQNRIRRRQGGAAICALMSTRPSYAKEKPPRNARGEGYRPCGRQGESFVRAAAHDRSGTDQASIAGSLPSSRASPTVLAFIDGNAELVAEWSRWSPPRAYDRAICAPGGRRWAQHQGSLQPS
jgi:hypothetical protein